MKKSLSIVSEPLIKIDIDRSKGKRIVISGMHSSTGEKEYRGIDIRHYYRDPNTGEYLPTKKGIFINQEYIGVILGSLGFNPDDLDVRIKNFLYKTNEYISILGG